MRNPSGLFNMIPAPQPPFSTESSTWKFQTSGVEKTQVVFGVNFAMKSARTWAFIALARTNLISYPLNSIAHLVNLPDRSGLCSVCRRGWFVGIMIG